MRTTPAVRLAVRLSAPAVLAGAALPGVVGDVAFAASLPVVVGVVASRTLLARRRRVSALEPALAFAGLLVLLLDRGLAVAGAALLAAALFWPPAQDPRTPGSPVSGHAPSPAPDDATPSDAPRSAWTRPPGVE